MVARALARRRPPHRRKRAADHRRAVPEADLQRRIEQRLGADVQLVSLDRQARLERD
jgi:hypothetical protein